MRRLSTTTPIDDAERERRLAVVAEALYLANLLIAPGLAFVALLWLWRRENVAGAQGNSLVVGHLRQTVAASLWAGALLGGLSAAILLIGGFGSMWSWLAVILYFTFFHSTLVLFGMFGLSRALAGQAFRFPLIGPLEKP